jgi:hypothetical protein
MKKLSNMMLLANFLSSLFYSMSYPYIYAETLKAVSTYYISFEQIITCISTVIFSVTWNRAGDKIFRHYRKIMIAEIIADIILFTDVIIFAAITKNLSCGGIRMRAKVNPTEKQREEYDNNANTVYALSTLAGTVIATITLPKINALFFLALIGNTIDNFLYLYIYQKIKETGEANE